MTKTIWKFPLETTDVQQIDNFLPEPQPNKVQMPIATSSSHHSTKPFVSRSGGQISKLLNQII